MLLPRSGDPLKPTRLAAEVATPSGERQVPAGAETHPYRDTFPGPTHCNDSVALRHACERGATHPARADLPQRSDEMMDALDKRGILHRLEESLPDLHTRVTGSANPSMQIVGEHGRMEIAYDGAGGNWEFRWDGARSYFDPDNRSTPMHLRLLMEELEAAYERCAVKHEELASDHRKESRDADLTIPCEDSWRFHDPIPAMERRQARPPPHHHPPAPGLPVRAVQLRRACVGGGSVYWAVGHRFRNRHIGDINRELINLYWVLQTDCEGLLSELGNGEYWYHGYYVASKLNHHRLRDWEPESPVQRAARFLFLNQTCINGLMRVNGRGRLNAAPGEDGTPHRSSESPRVCGGAAGHGGVPGRRDRGRGRAEEGSPGVPAGRSAVP